MGGRKRKTEASRLDEVDRTLYSTFCSSANSLSQLYTQAMNHQKQSFQAGERHACEKLYQWIMRQHEEGSRVSVADILSYLQNEMDHGGEDVTLSPRLPLQPQPLQNPTNSNMQPSPGVFGQINGGLGPRNANSDQVKNSVFSNALSSPVRRSLQTYQLAQGSGYFANTVMPATVNGNRNQDPNQNRESNSHSSNDTSMDMHSDSPAHESY